MTTVTTAPVHAPEEAGEGLRTTGLDIGHRVRGRWGRGRTRTVLAGLGLHARAGELTVLLGPNGTGKSTLLRTLAGLLPPLAGEVHIGGRGLGQEPPARLARRLAVVLTDRVDAGLLTARELAGLGRHPHTGFTGRLSDDDHRAVHWALEAVGAGALAERPAAELSDGERQRVLTARALAQEPEVVLLDEPTAFLDVPSRAALTVLLRDLARQRDLTVVVSTHDLELALRVADAVWLVDGSGQVRQGAPEDLVTRGAVASAFDAEHLAFDAESGSFALRRPLRVPLAVDAPPGLFPLLARALAREGVRAVPAPGDPSARLHADAGGSLTLRTPDGVLRPASVQELTRTVRTW